MNELNLKIETKPIENKFEKYFQMVQENGTAALLAAYILQMPEVHTSKGNYDLIMRALKSRKVCWKKLADIKKLNELLDFLLSKQEILCFVYLKKKDHGIRRNFKPFTHGVTYSIAYNVKHRVKCYIQFLDDKKFVKQDIQKFIGNDSFELSKCAVVPNFGFSKPLTVSKMLFTLTAGGRSMDIQVFFGYKEEILKEITEN